MQTNHLVDQLKASLADTLPGRDVQFRMAPSARPPEPPYEMIPAAVLIALYEKEGNWHFPLIHRVEDGYPHGGQISLPGGRLEAKERSIDAALREAEEEIGIDPTNLQVLGKLTPLPIPVSGYTATPVIAFLNESPSYRLQPSEVQAILIADLQELADPENEHVESRSFFGKPSTIPFFWLGGHKVWGATAMMLSELREILQRIRI